MKYAIYLFLGVLFITSCVDDKSGLLGDNSVSTLSFKTELKDLYVVSKGQELKIQAPEIIQANEEKPLSYEWEINYKLVSTEKDLTYIPEEVSDGADFPCRLKISNEDGAIFRKFSLRVPVYGEGLLVLSKTEKGTMLSFKAMKEGMSQDSILPFENNVFSTNNELITLGSEPRGLADDFYGTASGGGILIATDNPAKIVVLNRNTMVAFLSPELPVSAISGNMVRIGERGFLFREDNSGFFWWSPGDPYMFTNKSQQAFEKFAREHDRVLNLTHIITYSPLAPQNASAFIAYDANERQLLSTGISATGEVYEHKTAINGKELLYAVQNYHLNNNIRKATLFVAKDDNNKYYLVERNTANSSSAELASMADNFSVEIDKSSGLTDENVVFLPSRKTSILLYASGNRIYRYNFPYTGASAGTIPSKPDFTIGKNGDVIVDMAFDENLFHADIQGYQESRLCVAVNSADGKGRVYCYDYANSTVATGLKLLWEDEISGKITHMIYKTYKPSSELLSLN